MEKKTNKKTSSKKDLNPPKGYEEKLRRHNMLVAAKKKADQEEEEEVKQEKPKGYIISDQRGMQMHYEPKPRYSTGGMARGGGAAVKGTKFKGVF
jgi:hypothetical protein